MGYTIKLYCNGGKNMAIKSAYELAMERANKIKVDPLQLKQKELERIGKEAASNHLNKPKYSLKRWFEEINPLEKKELVKGALWVFIKNINLPNSTADIDKLLKIKEGIITLTSVKDQVDEVFTQLTKIYQEYINQSKQLLEECKNQFAPKLQQKAMQLAQQTGQFVPIEPETDRDFLEFHKEQQNELDKQYKEALATISKHIEQLV